jgi:formylglycine-generating enzyme required for sulfatase activity
VQPSDYDAWRAHFGNAINPDDTLTVAFHGTYDNPGKTGIFTKRGGQLTTIAAVGQFVPSIGSTIADLGGDVAIEGSTVAFSAGFANGTSGVFTGSGGALTTIARTGDTTSFGPLSTILSAPVISGNTVTFAAGVGDGTTKGIFAGAGGELTTIFKTGDAAPVGVFDDVDGALSMGGSKVAFRATYDGGARAGIFTGDESELTTVAQVGDDVPGIGMINSLSIPSMSGNEVAFYATWTGGEGFLSRKGTESIQLIASKSQLFPWANPLHGPHGINMGRFAFSGKRLAFRFYVAVHAGNSIGVIGIHSPEPATLAVLGLGLVAVGACARRRRSNQTPTSVSVRFGGRRIGALTRQIAIAWVGVGLLCGATAVPATAADLIHASAYLGETDVTGPYFQSGLSDSLYLGSRFSIDRAVEVESVGGHLEGLEGNLFAAIVPLTNSIALPSGSPFDASTVATTVFTAPTPSNDILVPLSVKLNPGHYALVFGSGQFGASSSGYGGMPTNNVDLPGRSSYFQWQYGDWRAYTGRGLRFVVMGNVVGGPGPEPVYRSSLLQPPGFEDSSLADNSETGQVGIGFVTRGPFNRRALLWNGAAESAINLHPSGFQYSEAYAIEGTSQVGVAYNDQYADDSHAMLWHGTAQSAIDLHPPGFRASRASGVLGSSQFGTGRLPDSLPFGFATNALLWQGTPQSVVNLHPAGFDSSTVTDITEASQVGYGSRANIEHALLWHGTAQSVVDLHPAGFEGSRANALSDEIQVGHGEDLGGGNRHALLWTGTAESVVDLHPAGYAWSSANFVSGDMQIGSGQLIDGGRDALLWRGSADSVVNLTPAGYDESQINDVSGNYQVGWAANQGATHAMVWNGSAQSAIDLHEYLPLEQAATSSFATSVAANGDIVGSLTYRAGDNYYYAPVLWKVALQPVPGDYNDNGTVDAADYVLWRNTLGEVGSDLPADGNGNGEIDSGDYDFWRTHFGQIAATSITSASRASEEIPEPGGFALFVLALVFAAMLGRKKSSISPVGQLRRFTLALSRRARLFSFVLCTVGAMFVCGHADAGTLYAATAGTHGELYILDPNTGGVLRDVGPLNDAAGRNYPIEGLAFQPHTRVLYGATHYSDTADPATVSKLVSINPQTAEVTVVGSFYLGNPGTMADIAFPLTGGLSGISSYGPPQIHHIDLATGITTPSGLIGNFPATVGGGIATMGGGGIMGGFANTMYFVTPTADELGVHGFACAPRFGCAFQYRTISNPAKPTGSGFYSALDFDGEVLYGLNVGPGSPSQTHLVGINTSTGAVTDLGRSVDGLAAIAFIPEPGTLVLSAIGLALLIASVFRRSNTTRHALVASRGVATAIVIGISMLFAPQSAMAVTVDWVTVGDPGNPAWNGLGSVPYVYRIGKYDVTVSQYVEFLNQKDATGANTLELYGPEMSDATYGGIRFNADGADGSKYEVIVGRGNHPVNYVTWYDAVRFANWLHNGQGNGDTENGAYTLLGGTPTPSNGPSITRNIGALVFLASQDEWTKAGHYLPGANTYLTYPTTTNAPPIASPPSDVINRANFGPNGAGNLTDVGAYTRTTSPYGAFDMIGNVVQWVDSEYIGPGGVAPYRHYFGTSFYYPDYPGSLYGQIGQRGGNIATLVDRGTGFRVASMIPEPTAGALALMGCGLLWWSTRRHKTRFAGSFTSLLCAIAMLAVAAPADAGTLYGATGGEHGELYILDPATGGVLRDVGPLSDAAGRNYPIEGLAFQPHTRVLYGATHYSDSADPATVSKLVTINPDTAEVTVVGSFFLGNPGTMTDLAFYENGGLVGIGSYGPPQVYNIDVNTGVSTPGHLIGESPATEGGGIAVRLKDGIRYVTPTADELATHWWGCDYFHGQCYPRIWYSKISNPDKPAGGGNYSALDFDGDVLYGLNVGPGSPPPTHLVRFHAGQAIDIGRSVDGLAAIAFVPEPGTLVLSVLGFIVLLGCIASRLNSTRLARINSPSFGTCSQSRQTSVDSSKRPPNSGEFCYGNTSRFGTKLFSIACVILLLASPSAMAATIDWVTVGNLGNGGNGFGLGDVPYAYRIGKYPVTVHQYVEFLNQKDPTGINTLALYLPEMSDENYGGIRFNSAAADGSKYEVIEGRGNHPANYITWYDAARFANWLHNGQGDGDTESGAYTLLGGTPTPSNSLDITRNPGARVYIPTEDEWTKAGYYLPGAAIYFQYPTSTNTPPVGSSPTGVVNRANILPGGPGTLTDVGAYTGTSSPYGAYDMWGNVIEWTDSYVGPPNQFLTRSIVGAAFDGSTGGNPGTGLGSANGAGARSRAYGFRVASVIPEPVTLAIAGICLLVAGGFVRRRRLPMALVTCAMLIGAAAAPVHAGSIAWVDEFQTGARDVALDGLGNVFVGGGTGFAQGIRKYDVAGNLLWTKQLTQQVMPNPPGTIGGIAADRFGNVYVTGYGGSFGAGGSFLTKYNPAGDLVWTRELAGADDVRADGVSADTAGNVYISGTTDGSLGGPNAGLNDAFLSKYDLEGNLQWVRQLGTTAYEFAEDVAADALGNVFISGSTQGSLAAPIGPVTNVYDAFVAKYDAAGNLQWAHQFNKNAAEYTEGLAVDDLGNVYIAGRTSTPGTNFHAFINKYDGSGTLEWTRQLGTGPPTTNAWGLAADSLGNVYMVGNSGAREFAGAFVAKYDTTGNLHWTHQLASDSNDYAYSIASDGAGNLYIGGHGKIDGSSPTRDYLARYVIPEPETFTLLTLAVIGIAGWGQRREVLLTRGVKPISRAQRGQIDAGDYDFWRARFGESRLPVRESVALRCGEIIEQKTMEIAAIYPEPKLDRQSIV